LLASGFGYMQWREWCTPGALQNAAMMVIRGSETKLPSTERPQSIANRGQSRELLETE